MNIEAIRKTRLAVQRAARPSSKPKVGFNMMDWCCKPKMLVVDKTEHNCETTCCIAGWAVMALEGGKIESALVKGIHIWTKAAKLLELNDHQSDALFFARRAQIPREQITVKQAVNALKLLEQGASPTDAWFQATAEVPADA